ncbi:hypothetical protein CH300_12875 [Rhodococcus sp. 15-1154-1]|nr:hypothetical protein [Rhodococcus sp. (in: high G+C Gram-positive bacteria)]OZF06095.1 hypothetical protein CH300_12875 [Rhodococcus sp. 15-1154-1]
MHRTDREDHPHSCPACGKTTWAGCGRHIDSVMTNVPRSQQCTCSTESPNPATRSSFFRCLFRR